MFLRQVKTASEALELAGAEKENPAGLISNCQLDDMLFRLAQVRGLASDFDGTVTRILTHWHFLEKKLPEPHKEEKQRRRTQYQTAMHGVSEEQMLALEMALVVYSFELYSQAAFGPAEFTTAGIDCPPRAGMIRLFSLFQKKAFVSLGIKPSIQAFVQHFRLDVDDVYAAGVQYDDESGACQPTDIVVTGNKGECVKRFLASHGLPSAHVLRMGDSWGDRHLFGQDAPNVFLFPPNEPEDHVHNGRMKAIEQLWDKFPLIILADDTFYPLIRLIELAQGRADL
ncbi:MAG: HAD family hydrolase [Patescibacteria group bacterium]|jgi:hypothetical protein